VYEAMDAGLPVVVRRHPSYDSLLPPEWQFDDVATAVRMIRLLAREPARERRVIEQLNLLADLRKMRPAAVLPPAYRRLVSRSRDDASRFALNTTGTGHGESDLEDARWAHHSFPS